MSRLWKGDNGHTDGHFIEEKTDRGLTIEGESATWRHHHRIATCANSPPNSDLVCEGEGDDSHVHAVQCPSHRAYHIGEGMLLAANWKLSSIRDAARNTPATSLAGRDKSEMASVI